jgi:hypothetical protein
MEPKIHRLPTDKQPLYVAIDFGNADVKTTIIGHFGAEKVFPHVVRHDESAGFKLKESQYSNNPFMEGGGVFRLNDFEGGFLTGRHADSRSSARKLGAKKYVAEHMKPLLATALLQVYPHNHDQVHLTVTHPQSATTIQLKILNDLLKGRHVVTLPNKTKIAWHIRKIEFMPEGRAAFNTMVLAQTGKKYRNMPLSTLRPGTNILGFDGGSFISAWTVGRITSDNRFEIISDRCKPCHTGINIMFDVLSDELRNSEQLPELANLDFISTDMLNEALMYGNISISGNPFEGDKQKAVEKAVDVSVNAFLNPIATMYSGLYGEGYDFPTMFISGGGGAGAYEYLTKLFNHPSIAMVEPDLNMMRFGSIRGAGKAKVAALGIDQVTSYVWEEISGD